MKRILITTALAVVVAAAGVSTVIAAPAPTTGGAPELIRNHIYGGKTSGVHVHDSGLGLLRDNNIEKNTEAGISVCYKGNPVCDSNDVHDGHSFGVHVVTAAQGAPSS